MIIIHRSQIQQQTIANLLSAGELRQDEVEFYTKMLSSLSEDRLMGALLESHQLRENCLDPINLYPIGEISRN